MAWTAVLSGLGKAVAGGAKAAAVEAGRSSVGRMVRGRRGKVRKRRDRIQERMFGGGGQEGGGGGALAVRPSNAIVPFRLAPTSQESVGPAPTGGGILGILDAIRGTLSQILEVEKQHRDNLQQSILNAAKDKEQSQRTAEQQAQEAKKPTRKRDRVGATLKNLAAGPLSWLMDFVKLGILNWIGDPRNKEAVQNIVKFFQGMVKVLQWTWKWIVKPLFKFSWIITEPLLKVWGAFFTFLGNLFTGKLFSDPKEFFRSLLDIPWKLIRFIPDIIGGFIKWLFPALWNSGAQIVGGIISAIKNLFGGIFGGGSGSKSATSGELGVSSNVNDMVNVSDGKDGKDGKDGDSGKTIGEGAKLDTGKFLNKTTPREEGNLSGGGKVQTKSKSDKPQGFMRGLAGAADWMTGGLTDFDKRGDSGLQTFQKGMLNFATGGLVENQIFPKESTSHLVGGKISRQERDNFIMSVTPRSGTMLSDVQRDRQVLDSTTSAASQETYAFGQTSESAVQEVSDTVMVGNTLSRHGQHSIYKTSL
jgi:hypothetical protein